MFIFSHDERRRQAFINQLIKTPASPVRQEKYTMTGCIRFFHNVYRANHAGRTANHFGTRLAIQNQGDVANAKVSILDN